ncbi:hypothetical protein SUGI_0537890 [Cryptomeria japonica]|nr:hypothetical protein SUGI_0537890 [Cryptomeria japonica]
MYLSRYYRGRKLPGLRVRREEHVLNCQRSRLYQIELGTCLLKQFRAFRRCGARGKRSGMAVQPSMFEIVVKGDHWSTILSADSSDFQSCRSSSINVSINGSWV